MTDSPIALAPNRRAVHLYVQRHPRALDDPQVTTLLRYLPDAEARRAELLGDVERRDGFLIGRSILRRSLSQYRPSTAPREWEVQLGPLGKPYLPTAGLWCSISHTEGVTAVAIAGSPVGLDIEGVGAVSDEVVSEFFACGEQRAISRLPHEHRAVTRSRLWATKEAYAKATEMSLDVALSQRRFAASRGGMRRHVPGGWCIVHPNLGTEVVGAIVVRAGWRQIRVDLRRTSP